MIGVTLALIILVVITGWLYSRYRHSYWSSRGITSPPSLAFVGHLHKMFSNDLAKWVEDEVYRKNCRNGVCGLYEIFKPVLMVGDPDLIRNFLVKDFDHFTDRRVLTSANESDRMMNEMLASVNGETWKNLRSLMSPTFTSGKMRSMFQLVCDKADILVSYSLQEASKKPTVDIKSNCERFVVDAIASCAFGFESNSIEDEDAVFPKKVAIFSDVGLVFMLKAMLLMVFPALFNLFNMQLYPSEIHFFTDVVNNAIEARKKGEKRGDFLDLLLEAQSTQDSTNKSSKIVLDDTKIVAQSTLFIIAGKETTASALAFASFLLAKHPDEQQRLRQELREMVRKEGGITYQGIMEAKFLEACVQETLRKYPPFPLTERVCTKTYQVPGTNITLHPGDIVQFPVWSLQLDEQYWPEPEVFRPDRFMPENKEKIRHYTHMPFGMGPRNCIAMRFALMETKIVLAKLVLAADMKVAPGHEEMKYSTMGGFIQPEKGVHLLLTPLNDE